MRKGMQGPITRLHKHSRRHPGREMVLCGEASELLLDIPIPGWRKALAIAASCGAGGHVSFGFGRFRLEAMS